MSRPVPAHERVLVSPNQPVRELAARYLLIAEEAPAGDALIYERPPSAGQRLTWADIANRSDDLLRQYRTHGVGGGTRCAVTLSDCLDMIPALVALWRLDATAVLVDPTWGQRLRDNVVRHSGSNFALDMHGDAQMLRIRHDDQFDHPLPDGTAMLGYTSGSTGDPKGVPFTHDKLALCQELSAAACAGIYGRAPARIGCSTRLSGSGVLNLNYTWAPFNDCPVVILPELTVLSARDYWRRIEQHQVEQTFIFPAQAEILTQVASRRSPDGVSPLCLTGSAPVTERLQRRFRDRFDLSLVNCFGISEAMCQIFFGNSDADAQFTTDIGVPYMCQARLVDSAGDTVAGPGEGELQLSGPTLFNYYYANPAATADAFDGRWFRTGDIARRDADGVYSIVGRRKHVIMKGGFSIYLNEVEEAALTMPDVVEAAAVPLVTDGHEDIGLLIRLRSEATATVNDVHRAIRDSLGVHRSPRRVVCVTAPLPRLGNEKLDRLSIQPLWAQEASRDTADAVTT